MGRFVRETLAAEGVDVSHVRTDSKRATGLVILGIRDRETFPLIFYRDNCADMAIAAEDFDAAFIASARALVVTGTHFSTPGTDWASRTAMRQAREAGTRIVLDIDYRPVLWGLTGRGAGESRFVESQTVTRHLQTIVPHCDLIVGTEDEIHAQNRQLLAPAQPARVVSGRHCAQARRAGLRRVYRADSFPSGRGHSAQRFSSRCI
jgi:5-dehydro-2-deoxygluconokinase